MENTKNTSNPDVNSLNYDDDFNELTEAEQEKINNDISQTDEDIPLPPDSRPSAPVEEPPESEEPPVEDDNTDRVKRIM